LPPGGHPRGSHGGTPGVFFAIQNINPGGADKKFMIFFRPTEKPILQKRQEDHLSYIAPLSFC
jgi:hypothetical protein